jgi:hypothetical protein
MDFSVVKAWFKKHVPEFQQILAVYGVVVFIVYGWTIYWYLWKLPSWLYFMSISEILTVLAYAMVVNFLESLIVIAVPIVVSLALPVSWFRDQFVAKGTIMLIILLALLMEYVTLITALINIPPGMGVDVLLAILGIVAAVFLVGRLGFLRKVIEEIAYRAVIFVYIFVPLTAVSFLVVVIRNVMALR